MRRRMSKYSIGLTCDFYRFVPEGREVTNFQNRNLAWLSELLRDGLMQAIDTNISIISAPQDAKLFKKIFSNTKVYAKYIQNPYAAWAEQYEHAEHGLFPRLLDRLAQQDLIIGFEIPPTIRRYLHTQKKRYINLQIHPLRFLRDLCFGATTNCPAIASLLEANQCDPLEITQQVRRYSALFARLQLPACSLPAGVPLLIGQTACDSVLISKGAFVNWENYHDILLDELAPFDTVALLEHPYQSSSASVIEYFRGSLAKNVIAIRGNSYGLVFSNREAPAVITLSSSLGVEAETIGHRTRFLLSDPRTKFLIPGIESPIMPMLGHIVLSAQFWNAVINGEHSMCIDSGANSFFMGEHYIRNSLDAWSYKALQHALTVEPSVKTIVPAQALKQERLSKLAAECCGVRYTAEVSPEQSIVNAHNQGIDLKLFDKPIAPGEKWDMPFNRARGGHYLCKGFHQAESWGVWSSERHSMLVIPLAIRAKEIAHIEIEFEVKVFEGAEKRSPVLKLYTKTQDIGYVLFRSSNMRLQKVMFEIFTPLPTLQLHFEISHLARPYDINGSLDTRQLGFGLNRFSVNYLIEPGEIARNEGNDCKVWGIDPERALKVSPNNAMQSI